LGTTLEEVLPAAEVVVDFTRPDAALQNALACVRASVHVVIGTTGFDPAPLASVAADANVRANVFVAPNFAIGAVLMLRFAAQGALARPTIHSVRLPGLVAHQEVIFGDVGQTLTIRHDSLSRESFMPGVLLAVRRVASLEQPLTVGLEKLLWPTNDAKAASG